MDWKAASRLPLALRLFLAAALPLALALGAALLATWLVGERMARDAVASALHQAMEAQRALGNERLRLLELAARAMADDPGLAGMAAGGGSDAAFDLLLLLGADGTVLDGTGTADGSGMSLATDPLVASALADRAPVSGFWQHGGRLYQAAIAPVAQDAGGADHLLLARQVDDAFSHAIVRGTRAELAWWLAGTGQGPQLVASSLPEQDAGQLAQAFAATPALVDALQLGHALDGVALELEGEHWLVRARPTLPGETGLGLVTALASASAAAGGYRQILELVVLAGGGCLLLAVLLSLWGSRRLLRPVERLADAAEQAAAGDWHPQPAVAGRDPVARLDRALDALSAERRGRGAVVEYVAMASRLLPDAAEREPDGHMAPPASLQAPRHAECVLLAIELPVGMDAGAEAAAAAACMLGAALQELAGRFGARLAAGDGERWLLAFDGPARLVQALHAARAAVRELGAEGLRPAAALAEGDVVEAAIPLGERQLPALLGTPGRQLLRLLCESVAGQVLVARPLGERIRAEFGAGALEVATGVLAGRRYYALAGGELPALPGPDPDPGVVATEPLAAPKAGTGSDALQPGERLGGRYAILGTLGGGALGTVYKTHDLEQGDVLALELLHPGLVAERAQLQRIADAIRPAERITHPVLQRVAGLVEPDGRPCIAREYVQGTRLALLLAQTGRLPPVAALHVAGQLCAGLAAVHAAGLLHLDINPGTVVLEPGGTARLMEVGSAAALRGSQSAPPGIAEGNPRYASPEQLAGDEPDPRSDIFSFGVLLSEMVCGGLPYSGDTAAEIYLAQVQQEPARPSALWPDIPPALERLILRCIARRREDRFQGAAELGAALAELRQSATVSSQCGRGP